MSLRIVVTGLIAQYPLGGVTWFHIQYLLGLAHLGHDVYYLEDSGQWPYNPLADGLIKDPSYNADYLAGVISDHLSDHCSVKTAVAGRDQPRFPKCPYRKFYELTALTVLNRPAACMCLDQ